MSEPKFTKGEWIATVNNNDELQTSFFGFVCGCTYYQLGSGIENKSNAHLIAAAPDMYAKLESIADGLRDAGGAGNNALAVEIDKLLVKARGE